MHRIAVVLLLSVGANLASCAAHPPAAKPESVSAPMNAAPVALAVPQERYTLAAGSSRIVRSLKTPMEVDAYVTRGTPELEQFVSDLTDLLTAYEHQSQGKLKFRLIEARTYEQRQQAQELGLVEQPFGERSATAPDRSPFAQGYLGLVFQYGSEKAVIPALPPDGAGLEFWVTNKIREIRDKADGVKHRIGVVTGKDELKLSDTNLVAKPAPKGTPSIKGILQQAFPFYQLDELDLKQGTSAIDPGLAGLIITQPQRDYTEPELRRIDEFLMLGAKSLVVFASAVNLKPADTSMIATLSTRGLEPLLDGYGIHLNRDAVFDHGSQFRVQVMTPDGQTAWLRHPGIPDAINDLRLPPEQRALDNGFAGFFRMDEIVFPFASSLALERARQPADVVLEIIAHSTSASSVEVGDTVDMKLRERWTPKPPLQERALAAYARGKLKSAFAGKPQPGITTPESAPTPSRVLVVSSSLFITNPFAYAGNGLGSSNGDAKLLALAPPYTKYLTSTILVVKNTLDWMIGDEDLISLSAKLVSRPHQR